MADREKVIKELMSISDWLHESVMLGARVKEQTILEAIYLLKEQEDLGKELTTAMELIRKKNERLKAQPKIVRCKDCRWGEYSKNAKGEDMIFCYNGDTGIEDGYLHEPDWFCAEGERRTD